MRLGFTTNIFREAVQAGEVNLGGLVDFADEEGFVAIEVRDDDASLPFDDLADFVKDSTARRIEISYAVNNDMFRPGDRELMTNAVERAALCGEGTVLRFLASQQALAEPGKKGYTAAEVDRIVATAVSYAEMAAVEGVSLALEHAREPLYGDGETYFGLHEILLAIDEQSGVPGNLGLTFDPANAVFRSLCKAPTEPERVFQFLDMHNHYIALVHYKTISHGEPTPVIADADIDNERLFEALSKVYDGVICLEIPPAGGLVECRKRIEASIEYLRKTGLKGYFAHKTKA